MVEESVVLNLVEKIYEAAADPGAWQSTLDAFCASYPGGHGTILHHDVRLGNGSFPIVSSEWDRGWVDRYNRHFAGINPWLKNLPKRPVGLAVPAEFMLDRASFVKTEFYHDFMKPQGMESAIGVTIDQKRDRFMAVSVILPEKTAAREKENVALLQKLAPHFRRAMQVNQQLAMSRIESAGAEAGLDRLAIGFVIVDGDGRLVYHNRAAGRVLSAADGLLLERDGLVTAGRAEEATALRRAVHGAIRATREVDAGSGGSFRIGRPSGKPALQVIVTPLHTRDALPGGGQGLAAILVSDPARPRTTTPAELSATFGITQAEAKILRLLADGQSVAEAGAALGVSLLTARTHVRNMFLKMGCTRQAELIRTVITHPTWMLDR